MSRVGVGVGVMIRVRVRVEVRVRVQVGVSLGAGLCPDLASNSYQAYFCPSGSDVTNVGIFDVVNGAFTRHDIGT